MAKNCETNGDYCSDFKRKVRAGRALPEQENTDQNPMERKVQAYVQELLAEKSSIDQKKLPLASKLLDQEVSKVQADGKLPTGDAKYVDIYREKPIKVTVKVLVPVDEYPKFNFVGKLLGPKGNSLRRLQEETLCKMAILGRGSMRDRQKEEEMRQSLDPKYSHLTDDLHVEISALGPAAEAHARIAFALAEIRKYLIPDNNDYIRKEQLREMESMQDPGIRSRPEPGPSVKRPGMPRAPPLRPPVPMRTATRMPVPTPRLMPAKAKIMSILDRARMAMEETYSGGYNLYEEPYDYGNPYDDYVPPPSTSSSRSYPERRHHNTKYETDYYRDNSDDYGEPPRRWKLIKKSSSTSRNSKSARLRASPYSPPTK